MSGLSTVMAALVATVFVVAAGSKLLSPAATISEFAQLRVPRPGLMARVVPVLELATAAVLLWSPPRGAALAAALIIAFTAVIVAAIRSGIQVSCGCLGPLSREQVSAATVVRNAALLFMTAVAGVTPSLTKPDPASILTAASLVLLSVVLVQLFSLRENIGRIWSVELAGEPAARPGSTTDKMKGIAL